MVGLPKEFHFRSDANNVDVLLAAKVDAVSLANYHALDFGFDALLDMLEILDKAGIAHPAGAGRTLKDAEQAAALEILGTKIGVIAFTDNEPGWRPHRTGRGHSTFLWTSGTSGPSAFWCSSRKPGRERICS